MTSAKVFEMLGFKVSLVLFEIENKSEIIKGEEVFAPEEKYYFISSQWIKTNSEAFNKLLTHIKLKGIMQEEKFEFRFGLIVSKAINVNPIGESSHLSVKKKQSGTTNVVQSMAEDSLQDSKSYHSKDLRRISGTLENSYI